MHIVIIINNQSVIYWSDNSVGRILHTYMTDSIILYLYKVYACVGRYYSYVCYKVINLRIIKHLSCLYDMLPDKDYNIKQDNC